ncbi:MAG: hypothetical protein Q9M11_01620 [Mariprofundaceae bacterium]|nr:hypothetical protein [Mariprofundaceae bacterium]
MKLCFSVDALSPAGDKAWRLQNNDTWRAIQYAEALQKDDAHIEKINVAESWVTRRMQNDKDRGLIAKEKMGMFDFLSRAIYAHAVLHRLSDAPIPQQSQMIELISTLTVGTAWLVYVNTAGQFTALDSNTQKIIGNLNIAVRGEIASSEGYIGVVASQNERLMDVTYRQFLEAWLEHLKTSNMSIFVPDVEKLNEKEEVLEKIQQWRHE